jgi:hypothetical protein
MKLRREGKVMATRRFLIIFALCLIFGSTVTVMAGSQDFIIENQTGIDIYELYISPYQSDDWEEDILDGDILADGDSLEVTFGNRKETYWDIMIRDEEGNSVVWRKFNLKQVSKITLWYDGDTARAEYE